MLACLLGLAVACKTPPVPPHEPGMPIVDIRWKDRHETVCLKVDHGCIIDWGYDRPPCFYLYDRLEGTRTKFVEWEQFLWRVSMLPDHIELSLASKCCVPFEYRMSDSAWATFVRLLDRKHIRLITVDDPRHTSFCYCENPEVRILYDGGMDLMLR